MWGWIPIEPFGPIEGFISAKKYSSVLLLSQRLTNAFNCSLHASKIYYVINDLLRY